FGDPLIRHQSRPLGGGRFRNGRNLYFNSPVRCFSAEITIFKILPVSEAFQPIGGWLKWDGETDSDEDLVIGQGDPVSTDKGSGNSAVPFFIVDCNDLWIDSGNGRDFPVFSPAVLCPLVRWKRFLSEWWNGR
ncbi:MAG: hypothetical protein VX034_15200, partial [Planctomycetota bacterium]|nr:hypothetical protein [Planctomycetota bacterium]